MTVYPDVQKRAQQEIDTVIGHDRLPTLEDRDRLPYLRALCTEVLRWMPAAPLGELYILHLHKFPFLAHLRIFTSRYPTSCDRRRRLSRLFHSKGVNHYSELVVSYLC